MKAVIGLGNPGLKYAKTKHNVGFMLLDRMIKNNKLDYRRDFRGKLAEARLCGERVFFLKPYTYMNLSGLAVAQLANYYKIHEGSILIIHDDMDLSLGRIRLRRKGSSGGHNGLKSIIQELGTQEFWRLKIGIGRPEEEFDVINHVLSTFKKEEAKELETVLDRGEKAVTLWLEGKEEEAMSIYNQ